MIQSWQLKLLLNLTTFFFVKLSKEKNIFCFDEILLCAYYKVRRARFNFLAAKKLVKSLGHQKSEITKRKTTGRHWKCGDFTIPHQNIQLHKHKYVFLFDILDFYKLPEFKFLLLKSRGDLNKKWFLKYVGFDQICNELTFIAKWKFSLF